MGPRNRRRLAIAAVVLGVIAAVGVAVAVLSGGSSAPAATVTYQGPTDARYDANSSKVVFGMTRAQIRRLVGPPEKVVNGCWQYQVNKVVFARSVWNAVRLCFYGGRYAISHSESNGSWRDPPTKITLP